MTARIFTAEEAQPLTSARGACRECGEAWPRGANSCGCGASIVAFASVPVIADLAETVVSLAAERDEALTRLGAVRERLARWGHGEECPAGNHEDCDPDEEGGDGCHHGNTPEECRERKALCECGVDALWSHVQDEPPSDARTLGEARAKAEKCRSDAAMWKSRAQEAIRLSVENMRLTRELRDAQERMRTADRVADACAAEAKALRDQLQHARTRAADVAETERVAEERRGKVLELMSELAAQRAIIEGRTVAPTDAEIDAHEAAGGSWSVRVGSPSGGAWWPISPSYPDMVRGVRDGVVVMPGESKHWTALDRQRRPCAWPVAGGGQ